MRIWVSRMTDLLRFWPGTMSARGICVAVALFAGSAQAGTAWETFVARCLDPFEHQSLPVVDGLRAQPIDQMHEARRVFGPTQEGYILILDAAPRVGERACIVEVPGQAGSRDGMIWRAAQLLQNRYVSEGAWLVSTEWIEPRVKVRIETRAERTIYAVLETDLES